MYRKVVSHCKFFWNHRFSIKSVVNKTMSDVSYEAAARILEQRKKKKKKKKKIGNFISAYSVATGIVFLFLYLFISSECVDVNQFIFYRKHPFVLIVIYLDVFMIYQFYLVVITSQSRNVVLKAFMLLIIPGLICYSYVDLYLFSHFFEVCSVL